MRNLLIIISIISFLGCEKVVDLPLEKQGPRLVIEAAINWEKGTTGKEQTIRLSTTTGYYQNGLPIVSGAIVIVTDSANREFKFIEHQGSGNYVCTDFIPRLNGHYKLTVRHNGQVYIAEESLAAVPVIDSIVQQNDLGLNSDELGIEIHFRDIPLRENFYLLSMRSPVKAFPEYVIIEDQYNPGTSISWLFTNKDLKATDNLSISLAGISRMYYNYMKILIQASGANAGPFQTPLTNPKGNIINQTTPGNDPLGYFSLSETQTRSYTLK